MIEKGMMGEIDRFPVAGVVRGMPSAVKSPVWVAFHRSKNKTRKGFSGSTAKPNGCRSRSGNDFSSPKQSLVSTKSLRLMGPTMGPRNM